MGSKTVRAPMSRAKRAKQFQPFDALVGLREAIAERERIIEPKRELTEDSIAEINKLLLNLQRGLSSLLCTMANMSETTYKLQVRLPKLIHTGNVYR